MTSAVRDGARPRVVIAGRGTPEVGGIPRFLTQTTESDFINQHVELKFENFGAATAAGKLSAGNVARSASECLRLAKASRGFDLVHIHSAMAPLGSLLRLGSMILSCRIMGADVIVHGHGGLFADWIASSPGNAPIARRILNQAAEVLVVSERVHDVARQLGLDTDITFLPNGVDTTEFSPRTPGPAAAVPTVLFAGHLVDRKGVYEALEASIRLKDEGLDHRLLLAGRIDTSTDDMARHLRLPALPDHVETLGVVRPERMPDLYRQADVFCLPSWWEAMPFSVLEAMASGLPVVATDVGDVARVVGESGRIVPVRDAPRVAEALALYLNDGDRRQLDGQRARSRVEKLYSVNSVAEALVESYYRLAGFEHAPAVGG